MLPIYEYIDPAIYLTDALEEKKERNSSFSLRSWAMQLGMKSHGPLHAILKGQRNIPKKLVVTLVKNLKLDVKEAKYLDALVDYQRSKTDEEKAQWMKRLGELSPKISREINDYEVFNYINDPLHFIIAEITQLKGFKKQLGWIKQKLRSSISLKEIEEVLARLQKLEILEDAGDKFIKHVQHIYSSNEIMSKAIQAYHIKMCDMAKEEISNQAVTEREYNGISFNIKKSDLPKIKESMRKFTDQIVEDFEIDAQKGDATYHLNVQLFSLTND
jgi:uncharacterized protein (TIGR02147 family)